MSSVQITLEEEDDEDDEDDEPSSGENGGIPGGRRNLTGESSCVLAGGSGREGGTSSPSDSGRSGGNSCSSS